jgi:protein-tyrosine phosphatase
MKGIGVTTLIMGPSTTANRVYGRLWMGGCPTPLFELRKHFNCLVLCANDYQLVKNPWADIEVINAPLADSGEPMLKSEPEMAVKAAGAVIGRLLRDQNVLVTCIAGRNRSGLVCAITLCKGFGFTPDQAISMIRSARTDRAFRNSYFEKFLREYCANPMGSESYRAVV